MHEDLIIRLAEIMRELRDLANTEIRIGPKPVLRMPDLEPVRVIFEEKIRLRRVTVEAA